MKLELKKKENRRRWDVRKGATEVSFRKDTAQTLVLLFKRKGEINKLQKIYELERSFQKMNKVGCSIG